MKKQILLLLASLMFATACEGATDIKVPDAITLSADELVFTLADAAASLPLTITAPAAPNIGIPAYAKDWLTVTDGAYADYKKTVMFNVTANPDAKERTATVNITAPGVSATTVKITQYGKTSSAGHTDSFSSGVKDPMDLGLGWNLGNQLDAINGGVSNETCWGNPAATQATFDAVRAAGFHTVRIPVTWMGHIGQAPDYSIEEGWMNRVYQVVEYAEKAGLNVILNTHHDENHGDNHWLDLKGAVEDAAKNAQLKEEIAAVWKQIALRFKDKGDFLVLESFNELIYGDQWSIGSNASKKAGIINEWNQVFVDAVRSTGGNNATRWLGVPGYAANPNYLKYVTVPSDPAGKTMLAFHCYDPYDYTIGDKQLANWGHSGTAYRNGENEINNLFSSLRDNYIAKGIPLYMGEYGCSFRSKADPKAWAYFLYYLEYVTKTAKTYGFPAILWDNGAAGSGKERHGYFNHGTGEYFPTSQEAVETISRAWNTTDAAYTLQSVYDSAPTF
ncbi:MAG: cellulase family glycosylhydrolase [Bacteroidales bacterium]|nr:cellulase family glycosylhydrolase [Bacteroidales bacterium]